MQMVDHMRLQQPCTLHNPSSAPSPRPTRPTRTKFATSVAHEDWPEFWPLLTTQACCSARKAGSDCSITSAGERTLNWFGQHGFLSDIARKAEP